MNIFYGVIILNLEALDQEKEARDKKSQEGNSAMLLENELQDMKKIL